MDGGKAVYWAALGDMVAGVVLSFYGWLQGPSWLTLVGAALVLGGAVVIFATRSMRT